MNNINVVYTPWANLKKTGGMDVGQIGFHRQKEVKLVAVEKKINEIVNRLEKTKEERSPDLAAEKESRDREERTEKKTQIQEIKRNEREEMKKKKELEELKSYSSLMKSDNMTTNECMCRQDIGPDIRSDAQFPRKICASQKLVLLHENLYWKIAVCKCVCSCQNHLHIDYQYSRNAQELRVNAQNWNTTRQWTVSNTLPSSYHRCTVHTNINQTSLHPNVTCTWNAESKLNTHR
ncbi:UNVERIFIED_CONTAM: hypothetical protein FKN15_036492 [Acipenser sinensis]